MREKEGERRGGRRERSIEGGRYTFDLDRRARSKNELSPKTTIDSTPIAKLDDSLFVISQSPRRDTKLRDLATAIHDTNRLHDRTKRENLDEDNDDAGR